ncbi:uncharacterized protein L969DRAFT_106089 [Mixia osmundae IAM 14324]|uniref:Tr-type G domain-containing protein n=1 Tax=Mixia osmundae (strain CBS 9802 / IAM 14324 / JCM 22182 / KY 12970) TaxID=764103 RepID=G7E4H1_MIXOS|nr:uncharacterized protein L969DRAFT_106089 [Mixia osmundae IAM 14324]KEI36253.1 hypothetical protein L969DRAFT_106089 [Mixia osmundae IAM 14324]GAA97731.1 hypothetical protein E5Q_04410 [Mixia osmundae IAM 14324]
MARRAACWTDEQLRLLLIVVTELTEETGTTILSRNLVTTAEQRLSSKPQYAHFEWKADKLRKKLNSHLKPVWHFVQAVRHYCPYDVDRGAPSREHYQQAMKQVAVLRKHAHAVEENGLNSTFRHIWTELDRFMQVQARLDARATDQRHQAHDVAEEVADQQEEDAASGHHHESLQSGAVQAAGSISSDESERYIARPTKRPRTSHMSAVSVCRNVAAQPSESNVIERIDPAIEIYSALGIPHTPSFEQSRVPSNVDALALFGAITNHLRSINALQTFLTHERLGKLHAIAKDRPDLANAMVPFLDLDNPDNIMICLRLTMASSFAAFQADAAKAQARLGLEHHAAPATERLAHKLGSSSLSSTASTSLTAPQLAPKLAEIEDELERKTIRDHFASASTSETAFGHVLASLLARRLDVTRQDVVLCIGTHNIDEKDPAALLDSGYDVPAESAQPLTLPETEHILAILQAVANEIRAQASLVYSPLILPREKPKTTAADLTVNDDQTRVRWQTNDLRILVRRIPDSAEDLTELRVAQCGNVDAGKSTLLGVLTKGINDDGRGRARISLFRHKHEIETGRTSSVGMEIMGFDAGGQQVLPSSTLAALREMGINTMTREGDFQTIALKRNNMTWDEVCKKAAKIVSFTDLAGHERYLKTTIFGLTGCAPSFVVLIVGANAGLIGMSKEHLSVALALSIPVICVVTKIDMTPRNVLETTLKQLCKILRSPGCRRTPVFVHDDGMSASLAAGFVKEKACPIFMVSNVTGEGLPHLKTFFNLLNASDQDKYASNEPLEFSISDVFSVPFVGSVVSGVVASGTVKVGDNVMLGPDSLGQFLATTIKSIQRKRVNVNAAEAGQSVSFALKRIRRNMIRKGMVLVAKTDVPPRSSFRFEAVCLILYHQTTIKVNYQAMIHCGTVRQTVRIVDILDDRKVLRTGDRASVIFEFIRMPEYVKEGSKLLFREGRTKGVAFITRLL